MTRIARTLALAAVPALIATSLVAGPAAAGGANNTDPNPYAPGTSSASENGNGKGKAVGRPASGAVGKADRKNPPGQLPGPGDINNGYECDGNNGIAKGNPAHTGCNTGEGSVDENN